MPPLTLASCLSAKYMTVLLLRSKTNHRLFHALEATRLNADEADERQFADFVTFAALPQLGSAVSRARTSRPSSP